MDTDKTYLLTLAHQIRECVQNAQALPHLRLRYLAMGAVNAGKLAAAMPPVPGYPAGRTIADEIVRAVAAMQSGHGLTVDAAGHIRAAAVYTRAVIDYLEHEAA